MATALLPPGTSPGPSLRRRDGELTRRGALALSLVAAAALAGLSGCASLNTVNAEVSTFGSWPVGRAAGTFVIERLPSQQAQRDLSEQEELEQGARAALQRVGFVPAAEGTPADVVVQIGARITQLDRNVWDDPFWWRGPFGGRLYAPWAGPYGYAPWGPFPYRYESREYLREVAVLIRDRASGEALYEAHARSDGITQGGTPLLAALYTAALQGFPATQPRAQRVALSLS